MQSLKRLFGIFFVVLMLSLTSSSQSLQDNRPIAEFNMISYDFGDILQGKETTAVFTLTNKGNTPLIVEDIKVSCGCTLVEWSQDPILPEQSAEITVRYNSNIVGTNDILIDFEFIIINNGSSDRSGEIAEEYAKKDSRIKVIHKKKFLGQNKDNVCTERNGMNMKHIKIYAGIFVPTSLPLVIPLQTSPNGLVVCCPSDAALSV